MADVLQKVNNSNDYVNGAAIVTVTPLPNTAKTRLAQTINDNTGVGAISGPILCSIFMEWFGLNGLFIFLIIAHAIIGGFGLYRMKVRETVENPDSTFTPVPATITPAGLELDPDTPATLDENPVNETVKT